MTQTGSESSLIAVWRQLRASPFSQGNIMALPAAQPRAPSAAGLKSRQGLQQPARAGPERVLALTSSGHGTGYASYTAGPCCCMPADTSVCRLLLHLPADAHTAYNRPVLAGSAWPHWLHLCLPQLS